MSNLTGQTFAGYEILAKLGEGGMGAVFKARQPTLNRLVALKIMASQLSSDSMFVSRFRREANAAAALNHENIVQVFTAGESDGTHYIAMEFVEGKTLRQHIESHGKLDPREAIAITVYVAKALQYAWNKAKLIHRDIKPENIFLSNAGEVKVGDLGLAKTVGGETTSLTQTGMMMGSPHYISPEQARGLKEMDFRADIYSLGCTLYHMLTGRPPYEAEDSVALITKHVNDPLPAIFKVWPTCPVALAVLVGKMLAKQRHERPGSYEELIAQLRVVHEKLKTASGKGQAASGKAEERGRPAVAGTPTPQPAVAKTPTPAPVAKPARWSSRFSVPLLSRLKPELQRTMIIGVGVAAIALIAGAVWWFTVRAGDTKLLDLGGGVKMELVAIPPGEFLLGSTKEEQAWAVANGLKEEDVKREGEMPRKAMIKQEFWLGRTEVTVAQWKEFVTATGYKTDAEKKGYVDGAQRKGQPWGRVDGLSWRDPGFGEPPRDNHPVCCVSWNDAVAFCEWATERERKAGRLASGQVVRLPTEAEWEYACRAGTQGKFWWGESKEDGKDRLNWSGTADGFEFTSPVDSYDERGRNKFGLADMLGNVYEWCLDEYDAKQAHEECYKGNPGGRVLRGGSFFGVTAYCRAASRNSNNPATSNSRNGFRVAAGVDVLGSASAALTAAAAQQPRQTLDLLALSDPVKDRIKVEKGASHSKANAWERRGSALAYVSDGGSGKLAPPVAINARSYEIEVDFERLSGPGRFHVDLPLDAKRIIPVNLDSTNLKMINTRAGNPWPANRGPRARVVVRLDRGPNDEQERITVRLDGELVVDWQGNAASVAQAGEAHPDFPGQPVTSLYSHKDSYEVRFWQLRVFDGEATVLRGGTTATTADDAWRNAINLLPLVDLSQDVNSGKWEAGPGGLVATDIKSMSQKVQPPYRPPEEYDFRVSFTPTGGNADVAIGLTAKGRSFVFYMKKFRTDHCLGFESIAGKPIASGPTAHRFPHLEKGRQYTVVVEVRTNGLRGYLDDKLVAEWATDYSDMTAWPVWRFKDDTLPGFGCSVSTVVFQEVKLREVSGKGTFTRGGSKP